MKRQKWGGAKIPTKTYQKICYVCGKSFETKILVKKYCSQDCYKKGKRKSKGGDWSERENHSSNLGFIDLCSVCGAEKIYVAECQKCGFLACNNCLDNLGMCSICTSKL
jgi:hypothetical protein